MRGKTKVASLAAIFAVIIITSAIFASGLVNVSELSLLNTPMYPDQGPNEVFIDPEVTIKDYLLDPGYQVGDTFRVNVNVSQVTDLFSYQVNVTWTPGVLDFVRVVSYGDFLARSSTYLTYNTSRIQPTYTANDTLGYASIAETILGDVGGITGSGRLFTIEFEILDYNYTPIGISTGGELPTMLLNSAGSTIAFTGIGGYFRNALEGDANIDKVIDVFDITSVKSKWGKTPASPGWVREIDVNDDGIIDVFDITTVKANWGRSTP